MRRFMYEAGVIAIILIGLSIFKWFDGGMALADKSLLEQPMSQVEIATVTRKVENTSSIGIDSAAAPKTEIVTTEAGIEEISQMIDVNTADLEQLMLLNGIGQVIAARIIDYRNQHGPFTCAQDLLEVKGIGEKKLEKILKSLVFP